jgi:2-succinyl-5-enolpyruvyl-6-hydroxy-3-cyclohexene-1-carboxylate synthase
MTSYTDEKQAQIVIRLLKAHGIRHIIASPGTTNMAFVGSVQTDSYFKVFSSVDERSAAYMACGMAAELGEPVVLSCTGATASRNYMPGLTEAFYRKLPVLALTSGQPASRFGHHIAQVIDRTDMPKDIVKLSVHLPVVKDGDDVWDCELKVNNAILALTRHGGGPAHINLPTVYSRNFSVTQLPDYRVIERWTPSDETPALKGRVAVFVGAHKPWSPEYTAALERFCEVNNAAVFCDHTSGYRGKYRVLPAILGAQQAFDLSPFAPDVLIHIGEISGDYFTNSIMGREVWRVSPDGEIRDTFRKLRHVFEMPERDFFTAYSEGDSKPTAYYEMVKAGIEDLRQKIPALPLSNIWLASRLAHQIPSGSLVHFAILNSLRAWNFFDLPPGVRSASNVGGFGIDGCTSSLLGAALASPGKLCFLVTGDLAFFYDINVLGNRHMSPNVRILLVNNGKGTEFTQYGHNGAAYGKDANTFVAAAGHFGPQSPDLVKGLAQALGMEYHAITDAAACDDVLSRFVSLEGQDRPMLVEAFVDADDESFALETMRHLNPEQRENFKRKIKKLVGEDNIRQANKLLRR